MLPLLDISHILSNELQFFPRYEIRDAHQYTNTPTPSHTPIITHYNPLGRPPVHQHPHTITHAYDSLLPLTKTPTITPPRPQPPTPITGYPLLCILLPPSTRMPIITPTRPQPPTPTIAYPLPYIRPPTPTRTPTSTPTRPHHHTPIITHHNPLRRPPPRPQPPTSIIAY
ncbi:extensin-like [Portunus trituberculatus]|uniref:extensin-like n=1 Tax=Portunus trituberculatus TaxID=210409 RepID=UPI001E1CF90E|nr:extensin-like [Portunus trituberculatus]